MADITTPYSGLARHGVRVVRDTATAIDMEKKQVRLARGDPVAFDRVIVSPGRRLHVGGAARRWARAEAQAKVLHAWKAGPADRGAARASSRRCATAASTCSPCPLAPYRCPPGPYERVCQVAAYFKARKPRSKILVLDENADVTSKGAALQEGVGGALPGHDRVPRQQQGGRRRLARQHREARVRRREGRRAERGAAA